MSSDFEQPITSSQNGILNESPDRKYFLEILRKFNEHHCFYIARKFRHLLIDRRSLTALFLDCQLVASLVSDAYHAPDVSASSQFTPDDFFPDSFPQGKITFNSQVPFLSCELIRELHFLRH